MSFRFISICSLKFVLKWPGRLSCVNTFSKVDVNVFILWGVVNLHQIIHRLLLISIICDDYVRNYGMIKSDKFKLNQKSRCASPAIKHFL